MKRTIVTLLVMLGVAAGALTGVPNATHSRRQARGVSNV
jgi:hypothetical protein